jgi:hypothetical protein
VSEFWVMRAVSDEKLATMTVKLIPVSVKVDERDKSRTTYKVFIPCAVNKKDLVDGDECTVYKPAKEKATAKPVTFDCAEPSVKKPKVS